MSFSDEGTTQLTKKTLRGLGWQALGGGLKIVFSIIPVAVLARVLTPAQFGLMTAATVVVLFLQRIALFGIGTTIVQLNPLRRDHIGTAYLISISSGLLFASIIVLTSKKIELIMGVPGVGALMPFLAIVFPLEAIAQTSSRILQRNLIFSAEPVADAISYVIGYYMMAIPLAYAGFGVWALVSAVLGFQLSRVLILLYYSWNHNFWNFSTLAARELSASGATIMIGGVLETIGFNADRFFLGRSASVTALGFYGRASDLAQRFSSTFEVFIWKTVYAAYAHRQDNTARLAQAIERGSALTVIIVTPLTIFLSTYGREFIETVYGAERWEAAVLPFQILVFMLVLRVLDRIHVIAGNARGRFRFNAWMQAIFAGMSVAICLVAAPFGIEMLSFAMLTVVGIKVLLAHFISGRAVGADARSLAGAYASTFPAVVLAAISIPASHMIICNFVVSPSLRLVIGAGTAGMMACLTLWMFPALFLGPAGIWLLKESGALKALEKVPGSWAARAGLQS